MSDKMKAFKAEVEGKIDKLLKEFADGKLNREQFYAVYERYNSQIELVEKALNGGDVKIDTQAGGTIVLKEKYMGKARGAMIFVSKTGDVIETLGTFGVAMTEIIPVLDRFTEQLAEGHTIERVVRQVTDKEWLLFIAGAYTHIVTVFNQEPSRYQTMVIQRMQREFENANRSLFEQGVYDPEKLVYPFRSFVTKSFRSDD